MPPQNAGATRQLTSRHRRRGAEALTPYLLVLPLFAVVAVMVLYPMMRGIVISFYNTRGLVPRPGDFAGLYNYARLLASPETYETIRITLTYVGGTVVLATILALVTALLLKRSYFGRGVIRAALTIPLGTPLVATALIWYWMFDPQYGVVNYFIRLLHLSQDGVMWLLSPQWAMWSVVLVDVWRIFPFGAIVLLTALQAVDHNLYDAAAVDGAGPWTVFRRITLPSIRPSLGILILLYTIWGMKRFDTIWILTQGGPVNATNVLSVQIYREAFRNFRIGSASALSVIGVLLSLIVSGVYHKLEARHES